MSETRPRVKLETRSRSRSRSRSPPRDAVPPASIPSMDGIGNGGAGGEPVKLYIGNIDYGTDGERLRDVFSKHGTVTDAFVPLERGSNRPRGFGFVTFSTREEAMNAKNSLDESELDGRTIRISESRPREKNSGPFNASGAAEVKLFVGNLSFDTETPKIKSLFETVGEVKDAYMPSDRDNGKHRGFAFVTMSAPDAEKAMRELVGRDLDGRQIRIEEAGGKSKGARDSDFRGGGGGGGGGYGGYGGGGAGYGGFGGGGFGDRGGNDRSNDRGGYDRGGYDRGGYDRGGYDRGGNERDYDRKYKEDKYDDRRYDDKRESRHKDDKYERRRDYDREDKYERRRDYDREERHHDRDRESSRSYRDDKY